MNEIWEGRGGGREKKIEIGVGDTWENSGMVDYVIYIIKIGMT